MHRILLISCALLTACDPAEPDDVRGVSPGEPAEPDPLTDTSANAYSCSDGPAFPDLWAGSLEPEAVSAENYDFDAGIADAIARMDPETITSNNPAQITDAVVAAYTEFNGDVDTMWIADESGGLMSYNVDWQLSSEDVSPGDRISFSITDGTIYFGLPEITGVADVVVGGQAESIYVVDGNTESISTETHLSQMVRAYGELVNDEGSCGGSTRCYTFAYGDNAHTLRIDDALGMSVGDCVQIVMPLSIYFEEEQYNVDNNNWVSTY